MISLNIPVIAALLVLLIWTLYETGTFFREWRDRKKAAKSWAGFIEKLSGAKASGASLKQDFWELGTYPTLVSIFAGRSKKVQNAYIHLKKLVSEIELSAVKSCHRARLGVRLGPMLGLMGTLIPMGPALKAITSGNIDAMSSNLIIAFGTTVTGLAIAGLCYIVFTVRQHWYAKDISDIDYLLDTVFNEGGDE